MSDVSLSGDALRRMSAEQLIALLDRLHPGDPGVADLDVDAIGQAVDPRTLSTQDFVGLLTQLDRLADEGADVDLGRMRATTFAKMISRATTDQAQELMSRPKLRKRILDEIFSRMSTHLRADRAANTKAVVHWRFATGKTGIDGPDYDRYETIIENGTCVVNPAKTRDPRVTITINPTDFLRLITRNASGPVLFMTGKLRAKGDLAFATSLTGLFDLPRG
jgi:putative sterol carrier protein